MNNLIPQFIADNFRAKQYSGSMTASAMFIDISGFTTMTRILMANGKEGAEVLNEVLNAVFEPVIATVYKRGGFISSFEGDAFTALFCASSLPLDCCYSASSIISIFKDVGHQKTKFGEFNLSVKIGISYGQVDWGIIGSAEHKTWFFRGEAIKSAVLAEKNCPPMQIAIGHRLYKMVSEEIEVAQICRGIYRLTAFNEIEPERNGFVLDDIPEEIAAYFLPKSVISYNQEGEFRQVVCLFISFERNDPAQMEGVLDKTSELDGYFEGLNFSDKGANCLVIFGAPVTHEDDSIRATRLAENVRLQFGDGVRLALTSGTVYAGIKGSNRRAIYGVIGDTVNLAARLMMKAGWGEVWVDNSISDHLQKEFNLESLPLQYLKGFDEKFSVHRLLARRVGGRVSLFGGVMEGRDGEFNQLVKLLQPLREGKFGGIVTIYGNAGIGKSRLIHELLQPAKIRTLTLQCDSILKKSLNPFTYFFAHYFDSDSCPSTEEKKLKFEAIYKTIIKEVLHTYPAGLERQKADNELNRIKSFIGALVGIVWDGSTYEQIEPKDRPAVMRFAIKDFIVSLSRLEPLVLLIEDIQWLDDESLSVFSILTRNVEDCPMIILASARFYDDGSKPVLIADEKVLRHEIVLGELSGEASKGIMANRLGRPAAGGLADYILKRTEGNPFYTEQFCLYMKENGLIQVRDGVCQLAGKPIDLPSGINAILMARIDRLSQELKKTVQAASVLGREFQVQVLVRLLDLLAHADSERRQGSTAVKPMLDMGEAEHIWSFMNELRYLFSHVLLRDAAYEMQLKARLRTLHNLAGDTIVEIYPQEKSYFADAAYHYDMAGNREKAADYYTRAGAVEKEAYHFNLAIQHFQRSLELNTDIKGEKHLDTATSYSNIGNVLSNRGDYEQALKYHSQALAIRLEIVSDDHLDTEQSFRDIAVIYNLRGDYKNALENYSKALDISLRMQGELNPDAAWIYNNIGGIHWSRGDYKQALEFSLKALEIYKGSAEEVKFNGKLTRRTPSSADPTSTAKGRTGASAWTKEDSEAIPVDRQLNTALTYINIGSAYWSQGNFESAMVNYQTALDIHLGQLGDKHPTTALSFMNIGNSHLSSGDYDQALENYLKALNIYLATYGERHRVTAAAYLNIGGAWWSKDDYDRALEYFQRALAIKLETLGGRHPDVARSYVNLGSAHLSKGDHEQALESFAKSLDIRLEILGERHPDTARSYFNLGSVYRSKEEYGKAMDYLLKSLNLRLELLGDKHPQTSLSFEGVIFCSLEVKDFASAYNYLNQWEEICQSPKLTAYNFDIEVLSAKLAFAQRPDALSVQRVLGLLTNDISPVQTADLHWEAARMLKELGLKDDEHRAEANRRYRELYSKSPKYEYRQRFEGSVR